MMLNEDYVRKVVQSILDAQLISKIVSNVEAYVDSSSAYNIGYSAPMSGGNSTWYVGDFAIGIRTIQSAGTSSYIQGVLDLVLTGRTFYLASDKFTAVTSYKDEDYKNYSIKNVVVNAVEVDINDAEALTWSFVGYKVTLVDP